MASITRNHLYTVDLNKPLTRQSCGILLAEGDNNGDCFSFALVRDGVNAAVDSTAVVSGYMIRQDGSTVPVNGTYAGNTVSVTLPKACYAQEGHFALAVKVDMSGATTTVAVLDGFIKNVTTDTVVDPGAIIPSLEDLLAQIERMETATEAANTAAANAKEFIITVTQPAVILDGDTSGITADKTFAEINAAINAGKTPVVRLKTQGKLDADTLHLYKSASLSIVFRQQVKHTEDYNIVSAMQCTFIYTGAINVDSVNFRSVPDNGTDGQVLVHKGESTYEWRDSDKLSVVSTLAPAIIPTATGEVVTVSDSANRPLAGLRLYGKTTQDGTPTPDAPVPLVNVGADGNIGVYARGKNLVDSAALIADPTGTNIYTTALSAKKYAIRKGVMYTISFDTENTGKRMYLNPDSGFDYAQFVMDGKRHSFSSVASRDVNFTSQTYSVNLVSVEQTSDAPCGLISNVQLEAGNTATPYEPYNDGGSVTASTPNGLPGIPVTSGGNYIDGNGQMWLCDEVDFGRGVYVQRVKSSVYTGAESWGLDGGTPMDSSTAFALHNAFENRATGDYVYMCSALVATRNTYGALYDGMFFVNGYGHIILATSQYNTVEGWKAYLTANPMTVMCAIANPIETPIPADELAAYRAMTSQYPNTTVYNDAGAGMAVDYIADTRNYIDQRIAALLNA